MQKSGKQIRSLYLAGLIILSATLLFSAFMLINRYLKIRAAETVLALQRQAVTYEPVELASVPESSAVTAEESDTPAGELTDEVTEKPPIRVDFNALTALNPDVKAWLYCADTEINFAVMQSGDNDYYLYHLADGSYGIYGSVFLDYRCAGDFSDLNTILYGHDMQNGSIFGGLELFRDQAYYEQHSVMYLLTPTHNYRLDAVCGFLHTIDAVLYDLPADIDGTENSVWTGIARSTFDSPILPKSDDRYVTLSSCADDYSGARYALMLRMTEIG